MTCSAPCPAVDVLDQESFGRLEPEWHELIDRTYDSRIFLTPTWFHTWWYYFGSDTPFFLTLRGEDSTLQGLLPLQVLHRHGERVLALLGDPNVADYMDALADKQDAQRILTLLWSQALAEVPWDRIELRHVPSRSPLISALQSAAADIGLEISVSEDEVCPVALLCNSWEGYLEMLSKKQRHEIRRKLRRCLDGVAWDWRTAHSPGDLDRDLPIFFRLHEASGSHKARFMTTNMREFFYGLAATLLDEGVLRLSILRRDGADVAASMAFLYRGRYLLYNSGYDPTYAAYSPGIASVALAMQDAIAEKAVAFDFLSGDEPYKYQFGASNTYTCRIHGCRVG